MNLTHSIIQKHRGPKRAPLLLNTFNGVTTVKELCKRIEAHRSTYTNYAETVEQAANLWAGDVLELVMEAWFQYSNSINTFNTGKPGMIPRPISVKNYVVIDRDGSDGTEDHGVDARADTDVEGGMTIQIKYRQQRHNLTRNELATYVLESQNPRYNATQGRRLVITTADGAGGMGDGMIADIKKYYAFDNIYYANRFLLSQHMDGTSFWTELHAALEKLVG